MCKIKYVNKSDTDEDANTANRVCHKITCDKRCDKARWYLLTN